MLLLIFLALVGSAVSHSLLPLACKPQEYSVPPFNSTEIANHARECFLMAMAFHSISSGFPTIDGYAAPVSIKLLYLMQLENVFGIEQDIVWKVSLYMNMTDPRLEKIVRHLKQTLKEIQISFPEEAAAHNPLLINTTLPYEEQHRRSRYPAIMTIAHAHTWMPTVMSRLWPKTTLTIRLIGTDIAVNFQTPPVYNY